MATPTPNGSWTWRFPGPSPWSASPTCPPDASSVPSACAPCATSRATFFPNVDYAACADRGARVLGCGPAYARAVAEYSLGLALDLARSITREDRAFRAGTEGYTFAANSDSILLRGAEIGFIGFGNLGRALHELLVPFRAVVRVYDPWLPDSYLEEAGVTPASLDEVLEGSQVLFVLATITGESERRSARHGCADCAPVPGWSWSAGHRSPTSPPWSSS
ncbi:NAD(P)-dependent oxidoreductase [Streptomyces sp. ALI-76-A]|nr:NAD(P)-dependent oxidoreductase [Streptomyces sp. ALI-76-A]MDL5206612.1 NAD(P)-dependent oxidoreductase [Streptomyces sp. ALI-76-A]